MAVMGDHRRPGDRELRHARRAAVVGLAGWFAAALFSGASSPILLSITYVAWLTTFLALATCLLALAVAYWKRRHRLL